MRKREKQSQDHDLESRFEETPLLPSSNQEEKKNKEQGGGLFYDFISRDPKSFTIESLRQKAQELPSRVNQIITLEVKEEKELKKLQGDEKENFVQKQTGLDSSDPWNLLLKKIEDSTVKNTYEEIFAQLGKKISDSEYADQLSQKFLDFIINLNQGDEQQQQKRLLVFRQIVNRVDLFSFMDEACILKLVELDNWSCLEPVLIPLTDQRKRTCFVAAAKMGKAHILEHWKINDRLACDEALSVAFDNLDEKTAAAILMSIDKMSHSEVIRKHLLQIELRANADPQQGVRDYFATPLNRIGEAQRTLKEINSYLREIGQLNQSNSEVSSQEIKNTFEEQKIVLENYHKEAIKKKNKLTLLILKKLFDIPLDTSLTDDPMRLVLQRNLGRMSQYEFAEWKHVVFDLSQPSVQKVSSRHRDVEYHHAADHLNKMFCMMANLPNTYPDPFAEMMETAFMGAQRADSQQIVIDIILHKLDDHIEVFRKNKQGEKSRLCQEIRNSLESRLRARWADKSQVKILCAVAGDITSMLDKSQGKQAETKDSRGKCTEFYRLALEKQANFGNNKKDAEFWKGLFKLCIRVVLLGLLSVPFFPKVQDFLLKEQNPLNLLIHYYLPATAFVFTVMAFIGYLADYLQREYLYFTDKVSKNIYSFYQYHMGNVTSTREKAEDFTINLLWY